MFVPQTVNLTVYKGSTFEAEFHLFDASGIPFVLDGWHARMQIRETYESTTKVFDLTTENGGLCIVSGKNADGTPSFYGYKICISADDTAAVTVDGGVYDIELIDVSNRVGRIQQGTVEFNPEVTR